MESPSVLSVVLFHTVCQSVLLFAMTTTCSLGNAWETGRHLTAKTYHDDRLLSLCRELYCDGTLGVDCCMYSSCRGANESVAA